LATAGQTVAPPARPLPGGGREHADQPIKAIALMVGAIMLFTGVDGLSKYLTADYPAIQIVWVRYLFMLSLLLPLAALRAPERPWRTRRPAHQAARAACVAGAGLFFVSGLAHLPLAQATATGYVAPLFVTALSIPLLGEQVGVRRWAAVVVGFAGVLVIVRPTGASFEAAAFYPVLSSAVWALGMILTRKMGFIDPPLTTLLYTALVGAALTGVPALAAWHALTPLGWLLLGLCGGFNLLGQYLQVRAFAHAPVSLLAPFSYSSIVGSTAIGVVAFNNFPDLWTWLGAALVIASGIYTWHRERVRARAHPAPA
jgi:drug/metabolite transporter (DMT)-like permease